MFLSLLAAASAGGLASQAHAQQQYYMVSQSIPFAGTDDTGLNMAGNPVTYSQMLIQSYAAPSVVTEPNGGIQGAGSPDIVGTVSYTVQVNNNIFGGNSSSYSTAFYFNQATGLHYFGQFSASSSLQYMNDGATYNGSSTMAHVVSLSGENSNGQVIGYEGIEAADSSSEGVLGRHAFLYSIPTNTYASLGLTGTAPEDPNVSFAVNFNYSNITGGGNVSQGTYRYSTAIGVDNNGDASGTSLRYYNWGGAYQTGTSGSTLGTSTWFYNGSNGQTTETGLYGTGYSYQKTFTGTGGGNATYSTQNDKGCINGFEVGSTTALIDNGSGSTTSLGTETWEFSAATGVTTPVSLYQSGLTPNVAGFGTSYSGNALSYSYSVTSTGGTGNFRSSTLNGLNSKGQVAGYSNYYVAGSTSSKGQDAWIYTPGAGYALVGLVSNGFNLTSTAVVPTSSFVSATAQRSSTIQYLNTAGQSSGFSTQYTSANANGSSATTSNVAWFAPAGGSAIQIGLTDALHTATATAGYTYTASSTVALSNGGLVGGSSTRYTPGTTTTQGQDAWVYDSNTNTTYVMDPAGAALSGYEFSAISYISDTGWVVGEYRSPVIIAEGGGSSTPLTAFVWSEGTGFEDLGNNIAPNPITGTSSPFQALEDAFSSDPYGDTIFATGATVNQTSGLESTNPTGIAILIAVPEPGSLALLGGLAGAGLLRRRRPATRPTAAAAV